MSVGKKPNKALVILIIIAVALTAAIAVGTFIAVRVSNGEQGESVTTPEQTTLEGVYEQEDVSVNTDSFPYEARDGSVKQICMLNNSLLVLEDGCLSAFNSKGGEIFSSPHSYANPGIKVRGGMAILYDKASGQYRVFSGEGEIFNGTEQTGNIVTCDIAENGRFAVVSASSGAASYLSVYSKDGQEQLFEWKCSPERIVSVSLSPKGKNVAAAVLGAENGEIVSKVYFLSLDMTESPKPYVCESGSALEVKYISEKTASVLTDSKRIIVSQDGEAQGYSCSIESAALKGFSSDYSGNTAVLTDSIENIGSNNIVVFDKQNTEKYDKLTQQGALAVFCGDGRVYVLCSANVACYSAKGEKIADIELPVSCIGICASGGTVYCTNGSQVYQYSCS